MTYTTSFKNYFLNTGSGINLTTDTSKSTNASEDSLEALPTINTHECKCKKGKICKCKITPTKESIEQLAEFKFNPTAAYATPVKLETPEKTYNYYIKQIDAQLRAAEKHLYKYKNKTKQGKWTEWKTESGKAIEEMLADVLNQFMSLNEVLKEMGK